MAGKRFKALFRGTFKKDRDKPSANSSPAPSRSSTPVQAVTDHGFTQYVRTGQDTQSPTIQQDSQPVSIDQDTQPGIAGQDALSLSHAPMPGPNDALPTVMASDHALDLTTTVPVDVTPEDEAVAAVPSLDDPNSLWKAAYRLLQDREPDLAAAYADHLLPGSTSDTLTSSDSVAAVVKGLQAEREAKQWKFEVQGRTVKVRGQIEKLAKFLVWTDGVVKSAVSAQPYAALAWSAISIFIPLVTVGTDLNEAMLEGLESVTRVQVFWKMYGTSAPIEPQTKDFIDLVTNLYYLIIEYQARVICHLSLRQRSRAWVNVTGGTAWGAEVMKINEVDEHGRIFLDLIQKQNIEERWEMQISEILRSREILDHIYEALVTSRRQYDDETEISILEQLHADHKGYKNDLNPLRTGGTCEWFFQDPRYLDWRESNKSSLLWVSAGPGCGKSVLARALIDEHRLSISPSTSTVCYFFFKDGDERRTTCASALSAILHQIFIQDQSGQLINRAKTAYKIAGKNFGSAAHPLWEILLDCVESPVSGDIICLIDALDECEKPERTKFVDLLKGFYGGKTSSTSSLRFIVTSRPYDTIEYLFSHLSLAVGRSSAYIRFDGNDKSEDINREINLVIDEKVRNLPGRFKPKDQLEISRRLKNMQNRSYLWLHLVFRMIADSPSDYSRPLDVNALFEELPTEVSDVYEHVLNKSSSDRRKTDALFHILLAANRPLTLQEANEALTAALSRKEFESLDDFLESTWRDGFETVVRNLTGFLVVLSVEERQFNRTLMFTHQTVREFLTHNEPGGNWRGRFNAPVSHHMMASACVRVLLTPDNPRRWVPFVTKYAIVQWRAHYEFLNIDQKKALYGDTLRILQKDISRSTSRLRPSLMSEMVLASKSFQELGMSCVLGLDFVVEELLSQRNAININRQFYSGHVHSGYSLLHLGASSESDRVVKLLLEHGANPSLLITTDGISALDQAVASGNYGAAALLVDHTRGIPVCDNTFKLLIERSHHLDAASFLRLLLKNNPDMEVTTEMVETAVERNALNLLSVFVAGGKLLPLSWQALRSLSDSLSDTSVRDVEFLLDHSKNTISPEEDEHPIKVYYDTMMSASRNTRYGDVILDLILTRFPDLEISSGNLLAGMSNPSLRLKVVKLLLERGQNFRIPNIEAVLSRALKLERHRPLTSQCDGENILILVLKRFHGLRLSDDFVMSVIKKTTCEDQSLKLLLDNSKDFHPSEKVFLYAAKNDLCGDEILKLLYERCPDMEITEAMVKQVAMDPNVRMSKRILEVLYERNPAATVTKSIMWQALEGLSPTLDFFIDKQTDPDFVEEFLGKILDMRPYSAFIGQSETIELNCSEVLLGKLLDEHRKSPLVRELITAQLAKMAVSVGKVVGAYYAHGSIHRGPSICTDTLRSWLCLFTKEEYAPMTSRVLNCIQYYGDSELAVERTLGVFFEAPPVRILVTAEDGDGVRHMTKEDARDFIQELEESDPRWNGFGTPESVDLAFGYLRRARSISSRETISSEVISWETFSSD